MVEFSASYLPETAVFTLKVACRRFSTAGGEGLGREGYLQQRIHRRRFGPGGLWIRSLNQTPTCWKKKEKKNLKERIA